VTCAQLFSLFYLLITHFIIQILTLSITIVVIIWNKTAPPFKLSSKLLLLLFIKHFISPLGPNNLVDAATSQASQKPQHLDDYSRISSQAIVSEGVLQSGILMSLRQKYFLPFDALLFVKTSLDEVCDRTVTHLQVMQGIIAMLTLSD
jgi:hypothetical protein